MHRDDRAMLRELSRAVHDTATGVGTDEEPPSGPELVSGLAAGWDRYRAGKFAVAGGLVAIVVRQAAASWRAACVTTHPPNSTRSAGRVGNAHNRPRKEKEA